MKMQTRYKSEAIESLEGVRYAESGNSWENYSTPLGNGFFGANVFGRTGVERVQISEPSLSNPWYRSTDNAKRHGCAAAGVNSMAEIYFDVGHTKVENYERSLSLEDAVCRVKYEYEGVRYLRELFTSHPDRVLVMRFTASRAASVSFGVRVEIPFLGDYTIEEGDGLGKWGEVRTLGNDISISGEMECYGIIYKGMLRVVNKGGSIESNDGGITVKGADEAMIVFTCDTSYELCERVFYESDPKKKLGGRAITDEGVKALVSAASDMGYSCLLERHVADYRELYSRVSLEISDMNGSDGYTDELVRSYDRGENSPYLEALLFQYGRYLLISSSRTRLPAHLQGIWNGYCDSPWSCGYWHNINVQMNYWPSGPASLSETFVPYINYAKAYMKRARAHADAFVLKNYPENFEGEGKNGWIIGTGARAYGIDGLSRITHSGPGTGAFTSLLFWDYFDYTRDMEFLSEFAYPALLEMSLFFTKVLTEMDGKFLIKESASPENTHNGAHYHTVGCAFDQQMVYENFKRTIEAAELLGKSDSFIEKLKYMLPRLDPVLIGDDGQVKEYREETTYSSIGDPHHRHISHLVGLYPGTIINENTKEWLDGAAVTLTKRGDRSTCWAVAHRLLLWARTKTGRKCRDLVNSFMKNNILPNLWCSHPPFQIDGNFGYTAAVCEMLMQSHAGYIELLPSPLPEWTTGSVKGLSARGAFTVSFDWRDSAVTTVTVTAGVSGEMKIKLPKHLRTSECDGRGIFSKYMERGESISF